MPLRERIEKPHPLPSFLPHRRLPSPPGHQDHGTGVPILLVGSLLPPGARHTSGNSGHFLGSVCSGWPHMLSNGAGFLSVPRWLCGRNLDGVVSPLGAWPLNLHSRPGELRVMSDSCFQFTMQPRPPLILLLLSNMVDTSDWGWTGQGQDSQAPAPLVWCSS